jgi:hypothetical protein
VTVDQEGGYVNGVLYAAEDTHALLGPGTTYLLSTRSSTKNPWYFFISHPNASKIISEDSSLKSEELKNLAENDEKVKALQAAYPNEILAKADILSGHTYNSYASRHYDANGELIDDTVVLSQEKAASSAPSPGPSETPVSSPDASVAPSDASAGDMASPMPSDMPVAS